MIALDTSHVGHSLSTIASDQAKLATVKDSHAPPPIPKVISKGLINGFFKGYGRGDGERPLAAGRQDCGFRPQEQ